MGKGPIMITVLSIFIGLWITGFISGICVANIWRLMQK